MDFQKVFKRIEKKYLLSEETYNQLYEKLKNYVTSDKYGQSTICNIYFDTPNRRLIRTSIEKPIYKEKLRMRSYGVPDDDARVFVELKKKYNSVVYKRRIGMTLKQAKVFTSTGLNITENRQIENEIKYLFKLYPDLKPSMYISYERTAFYSIDNPDLRITFDSNVIYREDNLELERGIGGTELLQHGQRIMEIKIPGSMPLWLTNLLTELKIYPTSFSKYGMAYLQTLNQKKKDMVINYD